MGMVVIQPYILVSRLKLPKLHKNPYKANLLLFLVLVRQQLLIIVIEYDQESPQSQTTGKLMAP